MNTSETRQLWRCPFEAPAPARLASFVRPPIPEGYKAEPTVCPGYSTSLPEVIEIARGWLHWSKGGLRDFTGTQPTEATLHGIEIFDGAANECQSYWSTPRSKGGGADG